MSEFTKIATITFELVYESEDGESEFEFKKRIYNQKQYCLAKNVITG